MHMHIDSKFPNLYLKINMVKNFHKLAVITGSLSEWVTVILVSLLHSFLIAVKLTPDSLVTLYDLLIMWLTGHAFMQLMVTSISGFCMPCFCIYDWLQNNRCSTKTKEKDLIHSIWYASVEILSLSLSIGRPWHPCAHFTLVWVLLVQWAKIVET